MVMISHKHQFIFLKTRKTAGTSVEMALEPWCRPRGARVTEETPARISREGIVGRRLRGQPRWQRVLRRTDWNNHMLAADIASALGRDRWDRYRKVTTIRNPFDLLVSRYNFNQSNRGGAEDEDFDATRARFNHAVATEYSDFDFDHDIVHLHGRFLPDHVIRFENLTDDVNTLVERLVPGASPVTMPHTKNVGHRRKRPVADYYDRDSIAMVLKNAAWIFERFGYPNLPNGSVVSSRSKGTGS